MSMEVMSCRTQGDALGSLFLLGPVFSLSRWTRRLEEGQGRASKSKRAAGDRQGLQVGAMSTEEWTDRPLSVCETEWTDRHTKSPERQGQNRTPVMQSDPLSGAQPIQVPAQLCVPSPPQPSQAYLCVTESPMSLRTICGDP